MAFGSCRSVCSWEPPLVALHQQALIRSSRITKNSDRLARRPAVGKVNRARGEESAAVLAGSRNIECKLVAASRGRAKHLCALRVLAIVAAPCDVRDTC